MGPPRSILSNKALAYSGLPLQALMVYKGPVHSQPEQRRHPPSRILHQAARGPLSGYPENLVQTSTLCCSRKLHH